MSWWNKSKRVVTQITPPQDSAVAKKGEGAVEANKNFVHRNWDKYPEYVQDHFKRYDQINAVSGQLSKFGYNLEFCIEKMEEYIRISSKGRDAGINTKGINAIISDYDNQIKDYNAKIALLPDVTQLREINTKIEKEALAEEWVCWYGTGGLHWNKKGVVEDGYGVYDRK